MSTPTMCPRCKRAPHGGACSSPVLLAPEPLRQGIARAVANVKPSAKLPPDVRASNALALVDGLADTWARVYRLSPEEREARRIEYLRAVTSGDNIKARAMCLELDPEMVSHPKRGA